MHNQDMRLLISIGTGFEEDSNTVRSTRARWANHLRDNLRSASLALKLATQSEATHHDVEYLVERANKATKSMIHYHRFNAGGDVRDILLDEWEIKNGTNETKRKLLNLTKRYLEKLEVHRSLLKCARMLVMIRRQRAMTDRWESFARDFVYYCPENSCESFDFKSREQLREHAYDMHRYMCETPIQNDDTKKYACFWDQCQHSGVHVFARENDYTEHLRQCHGIDNGPKFKTRVELEKWLDDGRYEQANAMKHIKQHNIKQHTPVNTMTVPVSQPADASASSHSIVAGASETGGG